VAQYLNPLVHRWLKKQSSMTLRTSAESQKPKGFVVSEEEE
jgi:hypothetical protein